MVYIIVSIATGMCTMEALCKKKATEGITFFRTKKKKEFLDIMTS